MTGHATRADRLALPLATSAIKTLAESNGGCIRPVQLRRTDIDTGHVEQVLVPCGATLAAVCPACAERARSLRAAQCREGWHLEDEPVVQPAPPDDWQSWLLEQRADAQQFRDHAHADGQDITEFDALIGELDSELASTGIRGNPDPGKAGSPAAPFDPPTPGRARPAPPQDQPPHYREGLHQPGRQEVPAVDVPDADLR